MKGHQSQPRLTTAAGTSIPRLPSYTGLEPALRNWVVREARRFKVSPSFVLANCVSFASGIEVSYDYQSDSRDGVRRAATWQDAPVRIHGKKGGGK